MKEEREQGTACAAYELRLEEYLEGALQAASAAEVEAHLERCTGCREALQAGRLAIELLSESLVPAATPGGAFATRVGALIRAEQERQQQFWRRLELMASRLALTAAALVLVLTVYAFERAPLHKPVTLASQIRVTDVWPDPAAQPATPDEVLQTLAENGNGH
jgi:predicted anti-sigma-YlaC factor YlaD